ncbi:MAG: hypothetical protein J6U06_00620 [Spirochaetaceae bacterium]|nr:hypothetical protein [Spirochaetaceae bacterium]
MWLIWKGFGILTIFIVGASMIGVQATVDNIFGTEYWKNNAWPLSLSLIISGVICWFLGRYLNSRPGRTVIDKETGEELELRKEHSFFFIPLQYWGIILGILAIIAFVTKTIK